MKYRSLVNSVLLVTITALLVVAIIGVGAANANTNSLDNPGCEYDALSLVEPSNWTQETGGQIVCSDLNGDPVPPPPEGFYVFMPNNDNGNNASISQIIDVSGNQAYNISGQVGTFGSLVDYVRIEVEYRDGTGTTLPEGQTGYDAYPESADSYKQFETTFIAPADAETAVFRVISVNEDGSFPDAIFDDLNFTGTSRVPTANNIDGLEVDINHTLESSVHDDHGHGVDNLGDPVGNVSSFGGGDLGGVVTDHAAGTTTALAGGNLTLYANGTLELATPSENGTYSFDYRLENDVGTDDATVTLTVVDNSSFAVSVIDANESVAEAETWSIDVGVENVGTNVGTKNVTLTIEDEGGTPVLQDEQAVILAAEANASITFEWTPGVGSAGEYEVIVSSDNTASVNVTVYEFGSIQGVVVDANSKNPDNAAIVGANVTVRYPDDTEVETTTNATGEFAVENVPATGEMYAIEIVADGYHGSATTTTVSDATPVDIGAIGLDGNATIDGTVRDGATGVGVAGANATATTGLGSYEATTDGSGSYTIANVPGGRNYDITFTADGYHSNSTTGLNVVDGATHELNASLSGNATIEGSVESNASGQPIENASVTVVYPDDEVFTVENATDADGNFSITDVPGTDESYDVVVREVGFEDATRTVTIGDGAVADVGTVSFLGNATVAGTVEDETFATGVGGIAVNVSNGQYEFTTTTDGAGAFVVEELPGNQTYEVSVDEVGWESNSTTIAVGDGEDVSDVNVTIVGSDQLEATVYDRLLFENSSDDGFLDDVTVMIEHSTFGSVNRTAVGGVVSPVPVPAGEMYNLTATKSGYDSRVRTDVPNGSTVEFLLAGNATIDGTVTDELTGDNLENATITIEYPIGANATVVNAMDATGTYAIDAVPGTGETYVVTASLEGYRNETATTAQLHGGTVTANFELLQVGEATVSGTVTDEVTGSAVKNANVTVELDDSSAPGATVVYEATTAEDGSYELVDVIGGYDYNVSVVADGYENASMLESVSENGPTVVDFVLAGNTSISGTVVDSPFGIPLEDASVTAVGSQGEYAATTDSGGSYTIDAVPGTGETYAVTVRADGYELNDTTVGISSAGDGASVNLTLVGNATIVVTATDEVTGKPIGVDANVSVSHPTRGDATLVGVSPDGADEYRVAVPGIDDAYNVSIDATGYDSGKEYSTGPLGSSEQATITETLLGSAQLVGTVTDKASGVPIANATVAATRGAGTYATETAPDGTYTIEHVPGTGGIYAVKALVRAYEDATVTVSVPEAGATQNIDLVQRARFFGIEDVDAPTTVEAGETFQVDATLANLGSSDWTDVTELVVDGAVVDNESVDLDAGNDTTVTFEHAIGAVGTYDVQVRTSNESENATLDAVAPQSSSSPPPFAPSPDPDPDPIDVPDGVEHEETGVIERDGDGRSGVHFSDDSSVDWIVFDEDVDGSVGLAELDVEATVTDEIGKAPGVSVAAYRIEVPEGAENVPATIRLRVSSDRLDALDAEPTDLRVSRYVDDGWQFLETRVVASDESGVLLEARTPGFSNFAVSAVSEPEAVIDVDSAVVRAGEEVRLSGGDSTNRFGEIVAYEWTVGDRTFEGETATLVLDDAGDYRVELTVTNADGEHDTVTATLSVVDVTERPDDTSSGGTPEGNETPVQTASDGQPGFGILAALVALFVGMLFVRRR